MLRVYFFGLLSIFLIAPILTTGPSAKHSCQRSPSIGSPVNYVHKGFEQMYNILYNNEISAIPRQILNYYDKPEQAMHFSWYFPSTRQSSMMYISMGNAGSNRPSLENFFWTEVDASPTPNSRFNQILKILGAIKMDGSTRQPTQFMFDKGPADISAYTVECGNIKGDFKALQDHYKSNFSSVVRNFS